MNRFPYTQLQELNLDWIARRLKTVEDVAGQTEKNTADIAELSQTVDEIKSHVYDRVVLFVGDSYVDAVDDAANWAKRAAAMLGLDENRYAIISGADVGFARPTTYASLIREYLTTGAISANDITDIVIAGGFDDSHPDTVGNISTGMTVLSDYLAYFLPNANVHVGFIAYAMDYSATLAGRTWQMRATACNAYNSAVQYGWHVFSDSTKIVLHDKNLLDSSFTKPNQFGGRLLGNVIASVVFGGGWDMQGIPNKIAFSAAVGNFDPEPQVYEIINNNVLTVYNEDASEFIRVRNLGGVTLTYQTPTEIARCSPVNFGTLRRLHVSVHGQTSGGVNNYADGLLTFVPIDNDGTFSVRIAVNSTAFSDITMLLIQLPTHTVPAMMT